MAVEKGQSIQLIGGNIVNTGHLTAPAGNITLTAVPGESLVRLDTAGALLNVEISTAPLTAAPTAISPLSLPALLTGEAADTVTDLHVHGDGSVSLVSSHTATNGSHLLGTEPVLAGSIAPGNIVLAGKLETSSSAEGDIGGTINVFGAEINVFGAELYSEGNAGGGLIRVGGDYQGKGSSPTAENVSFDGVASVDAIANGDGGEIILWSDRVTDFSGLLSAKGAGAGQGGLVETSGQDQLILGDIVQVNTDAPSGGLGIWLLDPTDLTIVSTGGNANIIAGTNTPADTLLDSSQLTAALNVNNVTIAATNSITVDAAINATGNANPGNLHLQTNRLNLNESITLEAASSLTGTATTVNLGANSRLQNAVDATATGGTINLSAITYKGEETVIERDVTIQGQGAGRTFLSGDNIRRNLSITSGTTTINDITVQNGSADTGAGILVQGSGNLILTDSTFTDNSTSGKGGALHLTGSGTTLIQNTLFSNNQGGEGGAIAVVDTHTLTVEDSDFERNVSLVGNSGAIDINVNGSGATVRRSNLIGNQANGHGGAVSLGEGSFSIEDSLFEDNRSIAGNGGAISGLSGAITATNSIFRNNQANANLAGQGGAISTINILNVTDSRFDSNTANIGGAIWLGGTDKNSTISTTTLDDNRSQTHGGAIALENQHQLTIDRSTLSNNSANGHGGAIHQHSSSATGLIIDTSTLSGNRANGGGGALAIEVGATATLTHATITNNTASSFGGGIDNISGSLFLTNSLVTNNTAVTGQDISGDINSGGHNLVGSRTNSFGYVPTDLPHGLNANLAALADNGGTTFTHALLSGSPAINTASSALGTDQRGASANNFRDIGAYERLSASTYTVTGGVGQTATVATAYINPLEVTVVDNLGGGLDGVPVMFSVSGNDPTMPNVTFTTPTSITTNSEGIGSISFSANNNAGPVSINARPQGLAQTTTFVTNVADAAAGIIIASGNQQSTTVDSDFGSRVVAQVVDRFGNGVDNARIDFSVPTTGASGALSNTFDIAGDSGEGRVSVEANTIAGEFALTAESQGFSTTATLTNLADAASQLVLTGHPLTVTAGDTNPFTLTAQDQFGNLASGYTGTVAFSSSDTQAQLPTTSTLTGGTGSFSSELRTAGLHALTATDTLTTTLTTTQNNITVNPDRASSLTNLSGNNQQTLVNTPFINNLTVEIRDRFNNPIAGETVNFVAPASGASAIVTPASATFNALGQATTVLSANAEAGSYLVTAVSAGLSEDFTLENTLPNSITPSVVEPPIESPVNPPVVETPGVPPIIETEVPSDSINLFLEDHESEGDREGRDELFNEIAFAQMEQSLSEEYSRYWQTPLRRGSNSERVQQILQQAENEYKSRSAVVYAVFVPPSEPEGDTEYSSLLSRRLLTNEVNNAQDELLLLLIPPEGAPIQQRVAVSRQQLQRQAQFFNIELSSFFGEGGYQALAQQMYGWLLAPIEDDIQAAGIDELMYVLDEGLSTIPLAAMMTDDTSYVVERYGLSVLPSVGLLQTDFGEEPIDQTILAGGSETFTTLESLPAVPIELAIVESAATSSQVLLNEDFSIANLQQAQTQSPKNTMHIATHAAFNPGATDRSYIQFWEEQLQLDDIANLGLSDLELLILSACTTALGSRDAELGFAGLAAATGVEASIGSLWNVSDLGTMALMAAFYEQLQTNPLRLAALQQAQLSLLNGDTRIENNRLITQNSSVPIPPELTEQDMNFSHPFFWSGFTLVGNPWW